MTLDTNAAPMDGPDAGAPRGSRPPRPRNVSPPPDPAALRAAAEAAADMDTADWLAARPSEAERLGVSVTVLDTLRREVLQARRAAARTAEDARDEAPDAPLPSGDTLADIAARLADLPTLDREVTMKAEVRRLPGMTVKALRDAVRAELRRRRDIARRAHQAGGPPAPGEAVWPYGYAMGPEGLTFDGGEDTPPLWLAAPFHVRGEARAGDGSAQSLLLRWEYDGRTHDWAMPLALTVTEPGMLEAELMGRGLRVNADPAARLRLRCALAELRHGSRALLVSRTGWQGDAYLLADGRVFGEAPEPVILAHPSPAGAAAVATMGTLDGWKAEVAARVLGNPLPMFCLSAAFAGPLLHVAGEDGGGFHLFGRSKAGKTAAARAAVSVWGPPSAEGGLRSWRATANGLEAACADAGDALLTLDEIHQADPREVAGAIYVIGNGTGKSRMNRTLAARPRATWRTFILSTGEPPVPAVVEKAGQSLPAGAAVRLPSIPADKDAWPELHGTDSRAAFMRALHGAMARQHGTAAPAFLDVLAGTRARAAGELETVLDACRATLASILPAETDAQVLHVARIFGVVAAAGELGTRWGVLPWPEGAAQGAAATVLRGWLDRRDGGAQAGEDAEALHRLRAFLLAHGTSRFELIEGADAEAPETTRILAPGSIGSEPRTINRAGWRKRVRGQWRYFISPEAWQREIFVGSDPLAAARALADAGHILRDGRSLKCKTVIPGEGKPRLYHVAPGLLEREGQAEPGEAACGAT